jgi:dTDP-4-amino-4,6-dideoxygalactose transaminase
MDIRVSLSDLDYGPEEEAAVLNVVRSRWLTMGSITQEFEKKFAQFLGVKHALAVSNCTQALHLACLACGLGPGDEAVVPSLTFVATSNAVLYTGAAVRFADINDPLELTISPEEIEKMITRKTRAILVVHYGGFPCRMPEIMDIASRHGLSVIEDVAHAPGAMLEGRSLGTWGDVGCFSFFSNKNMSTGEGGMLVTNRDDIAEQVKLMRSHGMTTMTMDRHLGHAYTYDVTVLGYNDRIDEIRSSLGLVQLRKLPANNARRKVITDMYREELLRENMGIEIPFLNSLGKSAYHIFPILLPQSVNRDMFMREMRKAGVQTSIHYPPVHQFTYYRQQYGSTFLPITEAAAVREVTLPLYPGMKDEDVQYVLSAIHEVLVAINA